MSHPYPSRRYPQGPANRINGKIRAREIRVIGPDNQQVGIRTLSEGLRMAQELGVDLVEIAPEAVPPVCRLVDYGKFRYEESKKKKKPSESAGQSLKEIQLRPGIAEHDFETKLTHAREFLEEGSVVKVALRFRGREMRHPEVGLQVVEKFVAALAATGRADGPPKRADRNIQVMLRPLPRQQRAKPAREPQPAAAPKPVAPEAPANSPEPPAA